MSHGTQLLVFTDLDGTLLDHDTYRWDAANPALAKLAAQRIPLILNSSKTLAEQSALRHNLRVNHPLAAENGQVVAIPEGYFEGRPGNTLTEQCIGNPLGEIISRVDKLRSEHGFHFRGFSEMSDAEVAALCGFSVEDARLARQRAATEPLHWQDSESSLQRFRDLATAEGLLVTAGGRFVHVSGFADKGDALRALLQRYQQAWPAKTFVTVALGDSENDLPMLQAADHAIVIPRTHRPTLRVAHHPKSKVAPQPGPGGWNVAMLELLNALELD